MPDRILEFRSDTFTKPTPAMRKAMAEAEVGDDQYDLTTGVPRASSARGEDPTVNRLELRAAELVGKDDAVFVPSGMMGNLCGVLSQAQRGEEVILGDMAHIYQNEMGAYSVFGALHPRIVPNREGMPALEDIQAAIRPAGGPFPRTALLCLENTHNGCGGSVITPAQTRSAAELAHRHGARVHLDGARIFNAAIALGVDARELAGPVDTVQFCFSKGLAAPIGSILCGDVDTIGKARKVRKMLGGAMRQAGVIAAAALVALETMRDRLAEDHDNAKALALGLATIPGISIDPSKVVTNIVAFAIDPRVMDPPSFQRACAERGLRMTRYFGGSPKLRMVTHNDVTREDVHAALEVISAVLAPARQAVATPA